MPLFMYVGKMRQGKSYCAVRKIDEITKENSKNLQSNREVFISQMKYFEDREQLNLIEPFMKLLDCDQFPEYHEELKVPYDEFIEIYNKENKTKLEKLKPVRQIYSDINGTIELKKIPNLLKSPDDWRTTPKGSIIFYDEFQIHRPAFKFNGNVLSKDQMIIDISTIGHVDKDLYLITQDAENLNFSLRKLIDKMYFVKRPPQNIDACSIYTFDCFLKNPKAAAESKRDPKKYVGWQVVRYNDYVYSLYKSASSHDSVKRKIPLGFFIKAALIISLFVAVGYAIFASPFLGFLMSAIKTMTSTNISSVNDLTANKVVPTPETKNAKPTDAIPKQVFDLNVECRKGSNVEKPECVKWFDELSSGKGSALNSEQNYQISYNPNQPFDHEDIQKSISYEVTSKPVFSGCIKKNGRYVAYTQQGTVLSDVTQADCKRVIEDGNRPFNYFAQQQQQPAQPQPQPQQQHQQTTQAQQSQMSAEDLAKFQQAKQQGLI
jgi:hypothetical protein